MHQPSAASGWIRSITWTTMHSNRLTMEQLSRQVGNDKPDLDIAQTVATLYGSPPSRNTQVGRMMSSQKESRPDQGLQTTDAGLKDAAHCGKCYGKSIYSDTSVNESKSERRKELQRRLRSKLRALYVFRLPVLPTVKFKVNSSVDEAVESEPPAEVGLRSLDILYHPRSNRDELQQFLRRLQKENNDCWDSIKADDSGDNTSRFSIWDRKVKDKERSITSGGTFSHRRERGENIPEEEIYPPPLPEVRRS